MKVRDAIAFATHAHEGQFRKNSGIPYIEHPLAVLRTVATRVPHINDDILAAAVLHDVLEDTPVTIDVLYRRFGRQVALFVDWLTNYPRVGVNRQRRKQFERERLAHAPWEAQTIKYADILDNIKDIETFDPKFAALYLEEKRAMLLALDGGYGPLREAAWLKILENQNAR